MSVIIPYSMRTPWLGACIAFFLIWSLYTLDSESFGTTIIRSSTTYEEVTRPLPSTSFKPLKPFKYGLGKLENISMETVEMNPDRPLILYAYSETENARENFQFFLRHALHGAADFIFIINGESNITDEIPKEPNFRVINRPNNCYDMGAYAEVLQGSDMYKKYKRFILLNASIRGPFSPHWASTCWSDMYLGRLSDEVKLVGMTANCWPTFHVQSMILATDLIGIETLLHPSNKTLTMYNANPPKDADETVGPQAPGINGCFETWAQAVKAEISITSLIKSAGYKVDLMMSAFKGIPEYEANCNTESMGDMLWDRKYFGFNVHPFETVFMKSNRDVDPVALQKHSEWVDGSGYSSYDHCKGS